ncbi:MAG: polysaccharide lyase family protein [bacterium]
MRFLRLSLFLLALPHLFPFPIFRIGKPDSSYREFAIAGNYSAYPSLFPNDVHFIVGTSNEAKDFPYIHPGPADIWAGARAHSFRISFHLDHIPQPSILLTLYLVNTHYSSPPLISIYLNDKEISRSQLPPGSGDASLTDPSKGEKWVISFPLLPEDFRIGNNEIRIENIRGSWLLYDAILLEEALKLDKPEIKEIKVRETPFFIRDKDTVEQLLQIWLANTGSGGNVILTLEKGSLKQEIPLKVVQGNNFFEIPIPDGFVGKVKAKVGGNESSIEIKGHRKWLLFLAPSVHTDIGYTDIQTNVVQRHIENLKIAIEEAKRNPNFKWNLEVAWQMENFLQEEPELTKQLLELLQRGNLSLQALYANMLTGLCSPESLARLCLLSKQLSNIYHFPLESALLTDVPSAIFALPSILNAYGIKYFAEGINTDRARFPYPSFPFYWEGPDGGKVLFFPSPGYGWARNIGLLDSLDELRNKISSLLAGLEENNYPYDAYLLYGAFYDNELIDPRFLNLVEEWNAKYAYPKIIVSTNSDFFKYLEEKYKGKIPTYRLDAGAYWEDGAVSTAKELAMNRQAKDWATEAETIYSLASINNPKVIYPKDKFKELWRNILLFDEHTWGAWCSVSEPNAETTLKQWEIKASFAHKAYEEAKELREDAFKHLASLVSSDGDSVLIFNPLSYPRSDIARLVIPYEDFTLYDGNREIPWQRDGSEIVFFIKDVPALGYKKIKLVRSKPSNYQVPFKSTSDSLETPYYLVRFDEKGIYSIYDKELKRDLLEKEKRLSDYLYLSGPEGKQVLHSLEKGNAWIENLGPIFCDICFSSSAYKTPRFLLRLRLYKDLKRMDLIVEIKKEETLDKESVLLSFPFSLDKPKVRIEYPACVIEPDKEQFPQACKNWFTLHKWIAFNDGDSSLLFCSLDAPLISLGKPIHEFWLNKLKLDKSTLFSYLMHNHWHTNYKASQGGDFVFRYAILPIKGKAENYEASKFAWGFAHPLLTALLSQQAGTLSLNSYSFGEVKGALLTTLKKRELGRGWVLRLWQPEREEKKVEVNLGFPIEKLYSSKLDESRGNALNFKELENLTLPPSSLTTILLMR